MDFRRLPFNFTSTDPVKRQEELQRRFGLPAKKNNMYVDFANPGLMNPRPDSGSASNSPRLQHRVPIFIEGQSESAKSSVDAQNVDTGRKPHVRIIPIEIEGENNTCKGPSSLFSSADSLKEKVGGMSIPVQTLKHPVQEPVSQSLKGPRVCNIPIKIEGSEDVVRPKSPAKTCKVKNPELSKRTGVKLNGCSASKAAKGNDQKDSLKSSREKESPDFVVLKKIQLVEEKLKGYHADVEKFFGTNKDKHYRYLDEMLTRCMLELDEIDTMGFDTIRLARKAAVKKVQSSIDLLELKVAKENKECPVKKETMEVESTVDHSCENTEEAGMKVADPEETDISKESNVLMDIVNDEMSDALPEQINKKVESISMMETDDSSTDSDKREPASNDSSSNETGITEDKMNIQLEETVQIAEVEVNNIETTEVEPVVEEPSSDLKDENAADMDLDSSNCKREMETDESSVVICELENCSGSSLTDLEKAGRQLDKNLKREVAEASGIVVSPENSDDPTAVDSLILTADEHSFNSNNLNTNSTNVSDTNVSSNL